MKKYITELAGTVCVDSGQILLVDPAYLNKEQDYDEIYETCGTIALNKKCGQFNIKGAATAVATQTGLGDGVYPVYAKFTTDGRVKEVTIKFL